VEWTAADRYGNRELQGMPDELVRSFSKRTGQIDLEVERLEADGRERTPRLVKWTVHITRKPKAAPPKRGGGGCGRPSGPRGCGPCLGGWPPPLGSVWVGGIIGSQLEPWLGLVVGALAAMVAGWGLRFRASSDAVAWRRGAAGERRIARLLSHLERHGWAVLHDLAIPGSSANLDHLVIGPGGVFVIDSKQYRVGLQLDPSGRLWHGRYPLAPTLRAVSFEADRAARVLPDPGPGGGADRGRPRRQGPLGQGRRGRRTGGDGPAPTKHASPAPGCLVGNRLWGAQTRTWSVSCQFVRTTAR
jgi:hypothetical protein